MEIDINLYSGYVVTGLLYNSKKRFIKNFEFFTHANQINLWNGSIWGILKSNGKRKLLKRVYN